MKLRHFLCLLLSTALCLCLFGCEKADAPDDGTIVPSASEELTAALREEVNRAWEEAYGAPLFRFADGTECRARARYYGTYHGYVIIFDESQLTAILSETVAGYTFRHSSSFVIRVYRDGTFETLTDAYNAGHLTVTDIAAVSRAHDAAEKV